MNLRKFLIHTLLCNFIFSAVSPEDGGPGFEKIAKKLGYTTYEYTEKDMKFLGDPRAVKGGTLRHITSRFPATLRTDGQNANYVENSTIDPLFFF